MLPTDRAIATELRGRIEAVLPIRDLVVYGSRARGDATADSDLDVFVTVDALDSDLRMRISEIAWEVGFEHDIVISTVVATGEQLDHGLMGASPLVMYVRAEGVRP